MKVVLLDNIKGVGQVGDVKDVNDGYARNFLFPRKAARPATDGILKDIQALKAKKLQFAALRHQEAVELCGKLAGTRVELSAKANEQGTLFAGVEAHHVARALSATAGIQIPDEAVRLTDHIKNVGDHTVTVELAEGATCDITVAVTPEK